MDLTVGMISMNEEDAIKEVIAGIKNALAGFDGEWEILVVDSSTDETPNIAQEMGARVIRQYPPRGYGRAMEKLLRSALGDVIVTLDCDNTYPAEDIPKTVEFVKKGFDIVGTNRIHRRSENMPMPNFLANKFFSLLASILFLKKIGDVHTGMRAYTKRMIDAIEFDAGFDALPVDLVVIPIKKGFKYTEFNIDYKQRIGDTTLSKLSTTIATFKRIFTTRIRG